MVNDEDNGTMGMRTGVNGTTGTGVTDVAREARPKGRGTTVKSPGATPAATTTPTGSPAAHGDGSPAAHGNGSPAAHSNGSSAVHGNGSSAVHGNESPTAYGNNSPAAHGNGPVGAAGSVVVGPTGTTGPTATPAAPAATGTGTAVLLAAAPAGRGRAMDAASVLPALAAVPPGVLTGTPTATVVELADPLDPQTVLTRLRAAAAGPGPLVLCLAGQLHLDRRQQLPHLALARTTPATLRYTALPWHWLAGELGVRAPGTTTVVADLAADPAVWERLRTTPDLLHLGPGPLLYGRVAPAPRRGEPMTPGYLRSWAELWRSGARLPHATLHAEAAAHAAAAAPEALLLAPAPAPAPAPEQDPHPAILAAAMAGRHGEAASVAAAWEHEALRRHGPRSAEAVHWTEVRADLARLAGDPARSCELWLSAAEARLALRQPADDPDVEGAVDRAHHQWEQIGDRERARTLGAPLVALRQRVPGRQAGALAALTRRMAG
ncbi:hypothetical protein [Streptomyces venezuelae]|uniref:hypothetical protein n=1 Tax=Streptomyces venezuelae TaxID=54571 RepID=UPI0037DCA627